MDFFSKLFGGNNSGDITPTAKLMDENQYWQIIQQSLDKTTSQEDQEEYLINRLQKLTPHEMIGFKLRTDKLMQDAYTSEMWCAAYIMNGGCSDDGFEYFLNWVISRGNAVYTAAKQNPDSLITQVSGETDSYEFEEFWSVANEAFSNKTEEDLFDFIDEQNNTIGNYPAIEFTWEEEKPETMKAICPQLFEKIWKW